MVTLFAVSGFAFAGTEYSGKEMKQVTQPPPCPEWYGDTEWNVSLWGAYGFGGDDNHTDTLSIPTGESHTINDLVNDGAWGGGFDAKYFFHRYFGVGIEGYGLTTDRSVTTEERRFDFTGNDDAFGAIMGTLTLRFPISCTRFAPYVYGGGGVLLSNRERIFNDPQLGLVHRDDDDPRGVGQVGGGLEIRITRHIGWIADVNWNFTGDENFGMVRSGINFSF